VSITLREERRYKGLKVDARGQIRVERGVGAKAKGYRVGKMYYESRLKVKAGV